MCELCNLERNSMWYYEDEDFIICNCTTCKIPMIVSKDHDYDISGATIEAYIKGMVSNVFHIGGVETEAYIKGIVKGVFHGKNFSFRKEQRKVKNHFHWHIILE